eukprot:g7809.t1 g7809   contig26:330034-331516(-)
MSRARTSSGDRGSQQSQSKHFLPSLDGSGIIDSVIGAGDDDSELQYSNSQPDSRVGRSSPYRRGPRINDGAVNTSNRYVQHQQVHHPPPHNHNHPIQQQRRKKEQHAPHPMQNKVIIATTTIEDTMMNDNASSRKYSYYNPASVLEASSSARTTSRLANEQAESKRQALVQKLTSYTRGMDRRQVLRTINDVSVFPKMHTLKLGVVEDIAEAEREAARERGVLNGVKFLQLGMVGGKPQPKNHPNQPIDSYFLRTLREICGHMCDMDGVSADPMALYGGLLLRLSRSTSERDAMEVITKWLGGKELVVLPLKRRHHCRYSSGNDDSNNEEKENAKPAQPIDVELYVESGNVHAKVKMNHEFGIYRKADLESHGLTSELSQWNKLVSQNNNKLQLQSIQYQTLASGIVDTLKPWVFVDADVVERINFGSGSSVRLLYVGAPERKNSGYSAVC